MAVQLKLVMSDHPSSTGLPPIPSSTTDTNLLLSPTSSPVSPSVFYSQSTPNRPLTPPPNTSIPTCTPISNKTSGRYTYASETHNRDSENYRLAQETSDLFLGAMPPTKFLDKFLPISQDTQTCLDPRGDPMSVSRAEKELNMYAPFVSLVFISVPVMLHSHSVDHGSDSIRSQFEVH